MTATFPASAKADQTGEPRARKAASWRHLPGLDGLRAVAVVAVLLYHADVAWAPGGFLGVDLFFVLSGFLITSLLLGELERSGRIDIKAFYARRARRLLPALFAMLVVTTVLVAFLARDAAHQTMKDIPPTLVYILNWTYIFREQSYFEAMGRPPLLQHLWSLSVEEQFYILWPALLLVAWRFRRRKAVLILAGALGLASAVTMAVVAIRGGMPVPNDASRAYFGTDTHATAVLVGAALASVWRPTRMRGELPSGAVRIIDGTGVVALGLMLLLFGFVSEFSLAMYRGGFAVFALIAAILVAAVTHPASRFGRLMGIRPLRWLGERSYGIYLWHWPIFLLTRPGVDIPWEGSWVVAARLALVLVVAELSYRYIEQPIRAGGFAVVRDAAQSVFAWDDRRYRLAAFGMTGALVLATGVGLATAPSATDADAAAAIAAETGLTTATVQGLPKDAILTDSNETGTEETGTDESGAKASAEPSSEASTAKETPKPAPSVKVPQAIPSPGATTALVPRRVVAPIAYGDSVMLGASPAIRKIYPSLKVDAAVGRQGAVVASHVRGDRGSYGNLVILHTGNNGPLLEKDLRRILDSLRDVERVVVVNNHLPRRWQDPNNELYGKVLGDYPNVRMADWLSASTGHREYFASDQVHLNWTGAKVYAKLIKAAAEGP